MKNRVQPLKKRFYTALAGTIAVALCCFTPALIIALGVIGLGALTPYLDYVLFPALGVLIVVTVLSYRRWKKGRKISKEQRAKKEPPLPLRERAGVRGKKEVSHENF